MPCSPGVSCETLTAILMPLPVGMIFADPIFVPCAFTISAWAELGAAETNWTAAENHKSPATANRIRKRKAYLTERRFDIGTASILSHAASLQIARLANLQEPIERLDPGHHLVQMSGRLSLTPCLRFFGFPGEVTLGGPKRA